MTQKQTVKIFLATGNPTGLRSLELFNWNGKGFIIPRDEVELVWQREELHTQGVYVLIGEDKDGGVQVYVGESENIAKRIKEQNRTRDFWDTSVCFFSKDENLNKAHVKFLEELLIEEVLEAGRVHLLNDIQTQHTKLSESDASEVLMFAENVKLILASVGYTFLKKPIEYEESSKVIYVCEGPEAYAEALYTSEGIVVLANSLVRKELVQSVDEKDSIRKKRQELIESGVLKEAGDTQLSFTKEYIFSSPSTSAAAILGRHANGWIEWKRKTDNKTLDEVIRRD
jgi:hypothetical protein